MSVDQDGIYTFSDIISVNAEAGKEIITYPNPSQGTFQIMNSESNKVKSIRILDLGGSPVPFEQSQTNSGVEVNLSERKKGFYFLHCTYENDETIVIRALVN